MTKVFWISLCGINYCLNTLIYKCLLKIQNFSLRGNTFGYAYLFTSNGILQKVVLAGSLLKRKQRKFEVFKLEIQVLKLPIETKNGQNSKNT
jgi:hypothetical protein